MLDWVVLMSVLIVPQDGAVSTEIRQPVRMHTEQACRDTAAKNTFQKEDVKNGRRIVISIKAQCIYDPESVASVPARPPLADPAPIPPRDVGPEPESREWYDPRRYVRFPRN
jgi:hypothetical protein